jgi:biopolymer transport protein ExbB
VASPSPDVRVIRTDLTSTHELNESRWEMPMIGQFRNTANNASGRAGCRRGVFLLVLWLSVFGQASVLVVPAAAQESGLSGGSPKKASVDDGGSAPAADSEDAATQPARSEESFLSWLFRASGPIGVVISVMSFYLVVIVVWMTFKYRVAIAIPGELVQDVKGMLDQSKYQEAYERLQTDRSFLARVLVAGVRKLPVGVGQAQRAMELANEDATMEMEHRTTYLATVGTLGPMIGLVGTVYGMILAFRVIAVEGSTPQASQLAAGISTALFATLEGIAVSIPAIYFYSAFRNKIARLSLEVGMMAEQLLDQFATGVRNIGGAGTGVTPASAHPHPLAVSAALAAGGSGGHPLRTALPPTNPDQPTD